MAEESGLVAAIESLEVGEVEQPQAEQHDLFGVSPALMPAEQVAELQGMGLTPWQVAQTGRRVGRPKGAKNKRTEDWARFILSKYDSPLVFLAETFSRDVAVLAAELNCDKLEAFKVQGAAAAKLAEYVHQKQPIAINTNGKTAGTLVIMQGDPTPGEGAPGAGAVPQIVDGEFVEYQEVSDGDDEQSDDEKSEDW